MFAEPLITVLFATVFLGEKIRLFTVTGGLLIFAGVYIVTKR
jgi:drug/metabolite transporter (DMT)-like permease